MSFIDFPVFNVIPDDINTDELNSSPKLLIILYKQDYQGRYVKSLSEVIKAIKLNMESEVMIKLLESNESIHLKSYHRQLNFPYCIVFNLNNNSVGLNIDHTLYTINRFESFHFMRVDALATLMESQQLKKQFWLKLKEMFEV